MSWGCGCSCRQIPAECAARRAADECCLQHCRSYLRRQGWRCRTHAAQPAPCAPSRCLSMPPLVCRSGGRKPGSATRRWGDLCCSLIDVVHPGSQPLQALSLAALATSGSSWVGRRPARRWWAHGRCSSGCGRSSAGFPRSPMLRTGSLLLLSELKEKEGGRIHVDYVPLSPLLSVGQKRDCACRRCLHRG